MQTRIHNILKRLSALRYLARPLALASIGIVFISLGVAYFVIALYRTAELPGFFYYLTPVPRSLGARLGAHADRAGVPGRRPVAAQRRSGHPLDAKPGSEDEFVLGYRRTSKPPRITVLSGGAGLLILASLGRYASRLTCITPVQDPVEYYYRASSLYNFRECDLCAAHPRSPRGRGAARRRHAP
ncbi:MAG: hypothetical protein U0Z44_10110 [Kouleothrix sp.]